MGLAQRNRQAARAAEAETFPSRDYPAVAKRKRYEARKAAKQALHTALTRAADEMEKSGEDKATDE